jgi:LPXTG-motif cell wall-anchored protein
VIPEADSAFLIVGSLLLLGGLVGLRRLRRRDDEA